MRVPIDSEWWWFEGGRIKRVVPFLWVGAAQVVGNDTVGPSGTQGSAYSPSTSLSHNDCEVYAHKATSLWPHLDPKTHTLLKPLNTNRTTLPTPPHLHRFDLLVVSMRQSIRFRIYLLVLNLKGYPLHINTFTKTCSIRAWSYSRAGGWGVYLGLESFYS